MAVGGDFISRIQRRGTQVGDAAVRVVKAIGDAAGTELVRVTPVDTGLARSNWLASINNRRRAVVPPDSASARQASIQAITSRLKTGDTLFIANNVDYIAILNTGSSQQAPRGFFQTAVQGARRAGAKVKVFKG